MATPRNQSSPLAVIVLAIKTIIEERIFIDPITGLQNGYCYIARQPGDMPAFIAERFASICIGGLEVITESGNGMWALPMSRKITITIASRISVDVAGSLEIAFTDEDFGHLYLEEQFVNALQIKQLLHPDTGKQLLTEPMHLVDSNPSFSIDSEEPTKDMLFSQLVFGVKYYFYTERAY